jgi:hypothetical protein
VDVATERARFVEAFTHYKKCVADTEAVRISLNRIQRAVVTEGAEQDIDRPIGDPQYWSFERCAKLCDAMAEVVEWHRAYAQALEAQAGALKQCNEIAAEITKMLAEGEAAQ